MNVLIIIETVDHGVGRNLRDIVEGLIGYGHRVTVIWSRTRSGEHYVEWLTAFSHPLFEQCHISMKRSFGLFDVYSIFMVLRFIRQHSKFDVVHGLSSKGGAIARIVGFTAGIPSFYSPHAYILMDPNLGAVKYYFYFWIEKFLNIRAGVVATSLDEIDMTNRLGTKKYCYIPNGIDMNDSPLKEISGEFCVSFVGRLSHQKNPLKFISIVRKLSHLPVKFNIFGEGDLANAMVEAIPVNMRDQVIFWGYVKPEMIWKNTNLLVCTSLYEGFPYIFLDSMAHGVPIASTPVGGSADVIVNEKVGMILKDDSMSELNLFIDNMLNDNDYLEACRQACLGNVKRFSREEMVANLLRFYQE